MQNAKPRSLLRRLAALAGLAAVAAPTFALVQAETEIEPTWAFAAEYTADVTGVVSGAAARAGRYLDNLSVSLDGDLERAWGWRGARLHLSGLYNGGASPTPWPEPCKGSTISRSPPRARGCTKPGSNRTWAGAVCWAACMT